MPIGLSSVLLFFCLFVYLFVCLFTLKSSMIAFSSHRNQMFPIHPFPIASKSGLFSLQREFTVAFNRLLFSTFRRDWGEENSKLKERCLIFLEPISSVFYSFPLPLISIPHSAVVQSNLTGNIENTAKNRRFHHSKIEAWWKVTPFEVDGFIVDSVFGCKIHFLKIFWPVFYSGHPKIKKPNNSPIITEARRRLASLRWRYTQTRTWTLKQAVPTTPHPVEVSQYENI